MRPGNPNIKEANKLTRFSPDNQPLNRGRNKKLENQIKDLFKTPDLTDKERRMLEKTGELLECAIAKNTWLEIWGKMIEKTPKELEEIAESDDYPIGFIAVARALLYGEDKGQFEKILSIFTRKYGLPHQPNIGVTVNMNKIDFHNSAMTYEEAARMYEEELRNP